MNDNRAQKALGLLERAKVRLRVFETDVWERERLEKEEMRSKWVVGKRRNVLPDRVSLVSLCFGVKNPAKTDLFRQLVFLPRKQ